MAKFAFSETAFIAAPPQRVYSIIADYNHGHPRILPKRCFRNLRVEAGGYGAGTRIRFEMHLLGQTHLLHADVTEPHPGRVLVETDSKSGTITTFTVEPERSGSRVTFHTEMNVPGIGGLVQRWLVPRLLRPIYREELANLAKEAAAAV